jgi:tRNA (guanine37-N1)-methyltransferase
MQFNLLTLFPEYFRSPLGCGLMGKAAERGLVRFSLINPRDYTHDRHGSVDDRPYGGGPGMVMALDPLVRALEDLPDPGRILLLSPRGRILEQGLVRELSRERMLTLVCGRYEGVDDRLHRIFHTEAVSVGDFVLSGGEGAALCLIESVSRLIPGFMGRQESASEESFSSGLLEYPHFTRPAQYRGASVPEILLSGDHARIDRWRRERALETTLENRPDLLARTELEPQDYTHLRGKRAFRLGRNLFVCLLHYPVLNKHGEEGAVSLTNLDIHDISRVCRTYRLGGYLLATPLRDQQMLADRLLEHWRGGPGGRSNPSRRQAVEQVHVVDGLERAVERVEELCGRRPVVAATSAQDRGSWTFRTVRTLLQDRPVLLLFGTGHGLAPRVLRDADGVLRPLRFLDDYRHLSVRSAAALYVDRILEDFW